MVNETRPTEVQPSDADALYAQIVQQLFAAGLHERMHPSDEFQQLSPDLVKNIQSRTAQLGQCPGYHAHADILLACVLAASGDAVQSEQLLTAILNNPKHFSTDYALAHYNLSQLYLRRGDKVGALDHLHRAAQFNASYTLWRTYPTQDTPELILGAGAMGITLRIKNRSKEYRVLKVLWTEDHEAAKQCRKQVHTISQLVGLRVPKLYASDYIDPKKRRYSYWETAYLHDALNGETWLTHCGPLSVQQGFELGIQVAQVLEKAHAADIYHHNIQPDNLLLCDSDESFDVVVLNFGLATLLDKWYPQLSQSCSEGKSELAMQISMALDYVAPELRDPEGQPGPWSDIYSLAVTLYRLLTGLPTNSLQLDAIQNSEQRQLLQQCLHQRAAKRPTAKEFLTRWYHHAAAQGHPNAQYHLGLRYADPQSDAQDEAAAAQWFQRAAEQGHRGAQYELGWMYEQGRGVAQDDTEAVEWYRQAAEQNYAPAQYRLGFMIADGSGVVQNDVEAVQWYRQAAEQGYAAAQYRLALMCVLGRGTPQDDSEALQWCRQAAEQGYIAAQHNLGVMYARGRGVFQDDAEAVRWYRRAAAQGYAAAQNSLGSMYAGGRGVLQNDVEAARWYRQAATQGHAAAQKNLQRLRDKAQSVTVASINPDTESIPLLHGWDGDPIRELQDATAQQLALSPIFQDRFRWRLLRTVAAPEMLVIPAGRFLIGSPEDENARNDDEYQHQVVIAEPFAVSRYPLTFADYDYFCRATGYDRPADEGWGRGSHPVIHVSWYDAVAYCQWLSERTGQHYRLPTEAEWEYACRAGTATAFCYGDTLAPEQANYHLGQTCPVGQFPANAWGLHDMHGNVEEWVSSCYDSDYSGEEQHSTEIDDPSPRAIRGGSWHTPVMALRSAARSSGHPDSRLPHLGFRIVRLLVSA